ncbi:two pore domain potassium channel family protein [Pseudomonas caspiana]|nr:potassium channel family protein [Pseudomonas caspiana]TPG96512.1 two pore domain potassium channel family protein [Pseudomonas caspiana]
MKPTHASHVRREFYKAVAFYFRVVWPIFSILLFSIVLFGLIISYLEGWDPFDGIYFGFVTGLTIGYGELVPKLGVSRVLAIVLGFNGVLMTAIFAAISVRAIEVAVRAAGQEEPGKPTA